MFTHSKTEVLVNLQQQSPLLQMTALLTSVCCPKSTAHHA